MLQAYHRFFSKLNFLADSLVLSGSWLLSYYLRFYSGIFEVTKGIPPHSLYLTVLFPILLIYGMVFRVLGLYGSQRITRRTVEVHRIIEGSLLSILMVVSLTYFISEYRFSRLTLALFFGVSLVGLVSYRLSLRNALRALRKKGYNLRHAVIIGEGLLAKEVVNRITRHPEAGLNLMGYLSSNGEPSDAIPTLKCLGEYEEIYSLIEESISNQKRTRIQKVILALPPNETERLEKLLQKIYEEPVDVEFIPDVLRFVRIGVGIEDWDGLPLLRLNNRPVEGWSFFLKRTFDIVLSAFALLLFSPLFLVLSSLVKLTSRGPIFYGQERMGLDGRPFKMWKFRSMRVGAEQETGAVWARKDDDRRTPIGSFLRKTSLDEIPQFWNVLMGDMSLVGPRPERPVFVSEFKTQIPSYMLRHKVKAGITGWAQVNGWRGNTSLEKRIEYDLFYIQNWSIWFDIKILFLTLWKGFVNKNAY